MHLNCLPRMGEVLVHVMSRQRTACRCLHDQESDPHLEGKLRHGTRCLTDALAIDDASTHLTETYVEQTILTGSKGNILHLDKKISKTNTAK